MSEVSASRLRGSRKRRKCDGWSCRLTWVIRCRSAYLYSARGGESPQSAKLFVFRSLALFGKTTRKLTQMASHSTIIELGEYKSMGLEGDLKHQGLVAGPQTLSKLIGCKGFVTLGSRHESSSRCRVHINEPIPESLGFSLEWFEKVPVGQKDGTRSTHLVAREIIPSVAAEMNDHDLTPRRPKQSQAGHVAGR